MAAYYNENDPKMAAWLRELIAHDLIPKGEVDERSIEDVFPRDLDSFIQCHFFAGVGGWSLALRQAGWPDDRLVWTGSCPCQPFSAAGKGEGFADERHLWPAFFHLISQCQPDTVFGEQVEGKSGLAWLDLVQTDMEGLGYAFGAAVAPAAGFGAPHIRHRLYWMADASIQRRDWWGPGKEGYKPETQQRSKRLCNVGGLADTDGANTCAERKQPGGKQRQQSKNSELLRGAGRTGPVNGGWEAADWLRCTDGRWRAVEPGTFPLAHGLSERMVRLRGYGNAIVPQQAEAFVRAAL